MKKIWDFGEDDSSDEYTKESGDGGIEHVLDNEVK